MTDDHSSNLHVKTIKIRFIKFHAAVFYSQSLYFYFNELSWLKAFIMKHEYFSEIELKKS